MKTKHAATTTNCPCSPKRLYVECCAPLHHALSAADSAEHLMRSRYSAYVLGLTEYLSQSWHSSTRPPLDELAQTSGIKWLSLTIVSHHSDQLTAEVEFIARFKQNGRAGQLHECSRFVQEHGRWVYLNGDIL